MSIDPEQTVELQLLTNLLEAAKGTESEGPVVDRINEILADES